MNIGEMQRKLSYWAEQDAEHQFYDLYKLISRKDWLLLAHDHVATNAGSITAGCDGIVMKAFDEDLETNLEAIRQDLQAGTFEPYPVRRVYIPKTNGTYRPLGIQSIRDRIAQEALRMVLEPIYEADFSPYSFGFRPNRRTMDAIKCIRLGMQENKKFFWVIEGDLASYFDEIDHRLLRQILKKRVQDHHLLDLITRLLRCGIWEDGQVKYPQTGTVQGSVVSPLLANIFLHEFDDWYVRTYRVRPEWAHLAPSSLQYRRRKEIGGTLMLTRYADDWVAIWNGSRTRAEDIKAEITAFLAESLKLRLSADKTLITHIDDGFDFVGYRLKGDKRWSDGKWCLFSRVPPKAIQRFREAVKAIPRKTFTDEVAAFTALAGLIRGWGNYYAYAAQSRLMDSLDAFIYREVWAYCLAKCRGRAKRAYQKYTLPRSARQVGTFQLGVLVGDQVVRLPRLNHIPRKRLTLSYPRPSTG
jgi:RNA-directed DNA polymerase